VRLWRIAAETRDYEACDLSGLGAAKRPGRWNDHGQPVVYCALTPALAVLKTAAHLDAAGFPLDRYLVRIDVPAEGWRRRAARAVKSLPAAWSAIPAGLASIRVGSVWLKSCRSLILTVPSVIVPEEWVVLINPRHEDASTLRAEAVRRASYDQLFRR
jgi:RES domain-containing protein